MNANQLCTKCKLENLLTIKNQSNFINSNKIITINSKLLECKIRLVGNNVDKKIHEEEDRENGEKFIYYNVEQLKVLLAGGLSIRDLHMVHKVLGLFDGTIESIDAKGRLW